jgi:uncharacterized protein YecE (DUF72 family)
MKFGKVENPGEVDFTLPQDHPDTRNNLARGLDNKPADFEVYVGCAKWNRTDLKGFYPRGTKDELTYYSTQFNSIELNATFYTSPTVEQVKTWREKAPDFFRFYPKVNQSISHYSRLRNIEDKLTAYCDAISNFEDRMGICFLQLHDNFKPKDADRLETFVKLFPKAIPLAIELRSTEWTESETEDRTFRLFEDEGVVPIIVDTAGRRDLMHMRLTGPEAFIRYVGSNRPSDYTRLDDWVERIAQWRSQGLKALHFFVHQNEEKESPKLAAYFIRHMNRKFDLDLQVPKTEV